MKNLTNDQGQWTITKSLFAHFLAFVTYMSPYTRKYAYGEIPEKMREQREQREQNPKTPCKIRSFAFNLNVTFERTKIKRANKSRICENSENSENKNQNLLIL